MYLSFYGLRDRPFRVTPDPRFLYRSPTHELSLAQLEYGIEERSGFVQLTGEVGTGKTTLLHAVVQRLPEETEVAFVFNSNLTFGELLEYVLTDLGAEDSGGSNARRIATLNGLLVERARANRNTVLILDEAQNFPTRTLEQVRMLSNFESPTEKLLQIVLVGQPELERRLELPELRQLGQRIALRCRVEPLRAAEVAEYVTHRVSTAGGRPEDLFDESALRKISQFSRGFPRVINLLCDHSLLVGYADGKKPIGESCVVEGIRTLQGGRAARRPGEIR